MNYDHILEKYNIKVRYDKVLCLSIDHYQRRLFPRIFILFLTALKRIYLPFNLLDDNYHKKDTTHILQHCHKCFFYSNQLIC